jgi:hypothetical protein
MGGVMTDELERLLASPTVGAWRRQHGITGMCDDARHLLAVALAEEAWRRSVFDRLDGILVALARGARPEHITARLRRLADDLEPPTIQRQAAA